MYGKCGAESRYFSLPPQNLLRKNEEIIKIKFLNAVFSKKISKS